MNTTMHTPNFCFRLLAVLCGAMLASPAAAASGDSAWILTSTALVLMMTLPGLAMFYAGLARAKNVVSVIAQCFAIAGVASLLWVGVAYSLAFDGEGKLIGGFGKIFMRGVAPDSEFGGLPESIFAAFQMTFAIITPALIVGAYIERMRFAAVLLFSGLWVLVVYAPVTHWIWGGGWLAEMGVLDFAGGIVVHTTAGVSALVVAVRLGARRGFGESAAPPHNITMTGIGAAMLWVGWFGFNGGSALAANGSAGLAILATHTAAAAGALVWAFMEWRNLGKSSLVAVVTGMVAGLATVTPAAGFIGVGGGLFLGVVGGAVCYWAVPLVRRRLHIDDSLDVFAVHGVGGILGSLLLAVLALPQLGGLGLEREVLAQFGVQAVAVIAVALWSVVASLAILFVVSKVTDLRAAKVEEVEGLDLTTHGEIGYHID